MWLDDQAALIAVYCSRLLRQAGPNSEEVKLNDHQERCPRNHRQELPMDTMVSMNSDLTHSQVI